MSGSPASSKPSMTPVTGLSSPIKPTVPASRCRRPVNHATNAIAVATTETNANPSRLPPVSGGGAPSITNAGTTSTAPPATSCHDVTDSTSVPAPHLVVRMWPNADMAIAATDTTTPSGSTESTPEASMSTTPRMPVTAPSTARPRGRSPSNGHARAIMATGDVAMIVAARLVGSSWAAR
nr:hypothetical protein [uncultured bacterium]